METHRTPRKPRPPWLSTLDHGLIVLLCFTHDQPQWRVTDLAATLSIHKSTVSKILATLSGRGLVTRDEASRKYALGPVVVDLANVYLSGFNFREAAHPILKHLRDRIRNTVSLLTLNGDEALCVDMIPGAGWVPSVGIGGRYPLHAGSAKVLLALLPDRDVARILAGKLVAVTRKTITDPNQLRRRLALIRARGYEVTYGERHLGAFGITAGIRSAKGEILAALCVSGPAADLPATYIRATVPIVCEAAQQISQVLVSFESPDSGEGASHAQSDDRMAREDQGSRRPAKRAERDPRRARSDVRRPTLVIST